MRQIADAWMVCAWVLVTLTVGGVANRTLNVITPQWNDETWGVARVRGEASARIGSRMVDSAHLATDGQKNTVFTMPSKADLGLSETVTFTLQYSFDYKVKVIRYKIHVGDGTPESWYPRSWTLYGNVRFGDSMLLHQVTNATFTNGVFVGKFKNSTKHVSFTLEVTEDSTPGDDEMKIKIAEFEAFGPRGQYDRFVSNGFPCRSAPRYTTQKDKKKNGVPFTQDTKHADKIPKLFDDSVNGNALILPAVPDGVPNGLPARIVGYHFQEAVQVVQFQLNVWKGLILEANECDPTCDYFGEQGWKVVAEGRQGQLRRRKWLVKEPGFYRAYRVKVFHLHDDEFWFLECP